MDEKKKQILERDAKIRSLQNELDQMGISLKGHSEDTDGKVNRLEKQVKELTESNSQMKGQIDGFEQKMQEAQK